MTIFDGPIEPCRTCGDDIEPGDEHFPHEPDCTLGEVGWCTCHRPTHPDCCPNCNDRAPW